MQWKSLNVVQLLDPMCFHCICLMTIFPKKEQLQNGRKLVYALLSAGFEAVAISNFRATQEAASAFRPHLHDHEGEEQEVEAGADASQNDEHVGHARGDGVGPDRVEGIGQLNAALRNVEDEKKGRSEANCEKMFPVGGDFVPAEQNKPSTASSRPGLSGGRGFNGETGRLFFHFVH